MSILCLEMISESCKLPIGDVLKTITEESSKHVASPDDLAETVLAMVLHGATLHDAIQTSTDLFDAGWHKVDILYSIYPTSERGGEI